ncbi:LOW QUALITY PROTEIN: hypothetical protein Cgig2_025105 [Carnegiea gigantea]|uniref:Uncharacterized protein n=1 Tax=Carnegiea gigantea TaxID=171969 RepID=A0A9Q1QJH4_9CARY|nr:LOW QUALITY PROTEIN: hypothetical protein Cgig2_025105 [Carnegiea gigantea]
MRTFFIDSHIPLDYDDDVSLDDETFSNDFDNDIDLEAKTEYRTEFRRKIIQDDDDHMLLVNKMAKILKRRVHDSALSSTLLPMSTLPLFILKQCKGLRKRIQEHITNLEIISSQSIGLDSNLLSCDDNTDNIVESFKYVILKLQGKPTYTMLEDIRRCRTCKRLGYNSATYGRPRDTYGRFLEEKKRNYAPNPVGMPKKQEVVA